MAEPTAPEPDPVVALLADPTLRALLIRLGESQARDGGAVAVMEEPVDATPRQVQERLRVLRRQGLIAAEESPRPMRGAPTRWQLTPAGRDLYRLQALMMRLVARAGRLSTGPGAEQDEALDRTLRALADPATLAVISALAGQSGPTSPDVLVSACAPIPRRTLYRRLSLLVEWSVVARINNRTVPRTTSYLLRPEWRPAAAIPVLAAWWDQRHRGELAADRIDLQGLLALAVPMVHWGQPPAAVGTAIQWAVTGEGARPAVTLLVTADGLALEAGAPPADVATRASGSAGAWAAALVTDRVDELEFQGDHRLARTTVNAVRAALLTHVR